MKRILFSLIVLSTGLFLNSCDNAAKETEKKSTDSASKTEKEIKNNVFEAKEISWKMEIPQGYKIVSDNASREEAKDGAKLIKESQGQDISMVGLSELLNFKKDDYNTFGSNTEPFAAKSEEEYIKNMKLVNQILIETFDKQNIKSDTSTYFEIISGKKFGVMENHLSVQGKVFMTQLLYSTPMKGKLFSAIITYNDEVSKREIMDKFRASTFEN